MDRSRIKWLSLCMIGLASLVTLSDALAVMSIDMGSEFMKVAIVKPGVPMEVALNFESRRKTPIVVSMRNGERLFSDPAMATAVKYPKTAFLYLQDLLGKRLDNPMVERYQERFPFHTIVEDEDSNSIAFSYDGTNYTPEELLAMVLEHAKEIGEHFAEQSINEAVVTVPPYFNQAERRAMLRAGDLAGIKILQLMNDNTAVALNYGVFRRKSFNATVQHYMFFDMGASSASATVVAYQEVKEKNKVTGILDKFPQVTIKGVGFDRNLGGLEIQLRLRDHLAKLFNEQKKTTNDVTQNQRSMAKLFKEAGRLKQVLSANNEHHAQVEGLLDDQDFKAKVSRVELDEMCADIYERIGKVVSDALKSSEVTMDEINEVILMGGSTRVPKVQEHLQKAIGREELGKSINTDEAAALGAVYQAAHLGKGFKVKKFGVKEAALFPVQVEFERVKKGENGEEETKIVKRTLFGRNNPYPQKKVMTFNKHMDDFTFYVNYGEMDYLSEEFLKGFGKTQLQEITLEGVGEAYQKHNTEADSKGVKAHFKMDESGILFIDTAEFVFEKTDVPVDSGADEESTLSKLGNTISSLFGGGESEEDKESSVEESAQEDKPKSEDSPDEEVKESEEQKDKETDQEDTEKEKESQEEDDGDKDSEESKEEKDDDESGEDKSGEQDEDKSTEDQGSDQPEKEEDAESDKSENGEKEAAEEGKGTEKKDEQTEQEQKGEQEAEKEAEKEPVGEDDKTNKTEETEEKKKEKKEEKPKTVTIKEELKASVVVKDKLDPPKEAIKKSRKILKELKKKDEEKKKLEQAMNDLESFIIDAQDKLWQEAYEACSTDEEREGLRTALSEASDWMYDYDGEQTAKPYKDKLKDLEKLTKDLWERVKEKEERPRAIEALNQIMNYSTHFLIGMQNYTGEEKGEQPFTTVEYTTLADLIKETLEWNKTITEEQAATPDSEKPKMTVQDVALKIGALDREIKYLTNKVKTFKPKPPKKEKEDVNKTQTADKTEKTLDEEDKKEETDSKENETKEDTPVEGADQQIDEPPLETEEVPTEDKDTQAEEPLQLDGTDSTDEPPETDSTTQSSDSEDTGTHLPGEL